MPVLQSTWPRILGSGRTRAIRPTKIPKCEPVIFVEWKAPRFITYLAFCWPYLMKEIINNSIVHCKFSACLHLAMEKSAINWREKRWLVIKLFFFLSPKAMLRLLLIAVSCHVTFQGREILMRMLEVFVRKFQSIAKHHVPAIFNRWYSVLFHFQIQ